MSQRPTLSSIDPTDDAANDAAKELEKTFDQNENADDAVSNEPPADPPTNSPRDEVEYDAQHDAAALTQNENLLAESEPKPRKRRGLTSILLALLVLALIGSGAINWLQYQALNATQTEKLAVETALSRAQARTSQAEGAYTALRERVATVNQQILALQANLADLTQLADADHANGSTSTEASGPPAVSSPPPRTNRSEDTSGR